MKIVMQNARRPGLLSIVTAAFVAASTSLCATELLQNNSFDQGSNYWHVTSAAGTLNLFAVTGQVNLHIPGYNGNVINQDLDMTNAASATGTASITLRKNTTTLTTTNTIAVFVAYTDDTGQTNRLLLFEPANADMPAGVTTNLTTSFALATNAQRIVRYDIDKIYNGNYDAFDVSLDVTPKVEPVINPRLSKWFEILSTNAPGDRTLWTDAYNQTVAVGDTVHVTWVSMTVDATPAVQKLCYRRSLDGGKTFEPTLVLDADTAGFSLLFSSLGQASYTPQYLAVDGTNVHIVITGQTAEGKGIYYYRSTNAGATFHPRRLLANLNVDEAAGAAWVVAGGGKVTIAFFYSHAIFVTDPVPGTYWPSYIGGLSSPDNGETFWSQLIDAQDLGAVFIGDLKQSGDTVALAWRYADTQPYTHGSRMFVAVSTNGGVSFPFTHDVMGAHEVAFECENMRLAVDTPNVYALWGATTNVTTNGNLLELFFARSTDNGASFDAPFPLSAPGQDYYVGCGLSSAIAARGSNVYAMHAFGNQALFHVSHDRGATFATPRDLASGSYTLAPSGPFGPILIIDPTSSDGRNVHVFWCGDRYTRSADAGATFLPAVHLGTYWTTPYWYSWPQAAVDNGGAFLFTWSASYYRTDDDVLFRRYAAPPAPAATNMALHLEYEWVLPPQGMPRMDNLQVPTTPALQFSNACTVEMWIRFTDLSTAPWFLFADYDSSSALLALGLDADGWGAPPDWRAFRADIGTQDGKVFSVISGDTIRADVWHHVALTYDAAMGADNLRLYVDGQLNASTTATGLLARSTGPIWVGYGNGYATFSGDIDDLRFWNRARTAQEIRDNFTGPLLGTEPGLVGYYPLDGTTREVTGNGRDGVLMYKESFGRGADVQPVLQMDSLTASQVTLSWLTFGASYKLQATANLDA
ncbi:MAG: LamG domain-containing protein, partial [Verrucomicrobia bacterium]|nr:LamG domain-containing protein [Verrucomicrobiota bacterium]